MGMDIPRRGAASPPEKSSATIYPQWEQSIPQKESKQQQLLRFFKVVDVTDNFILRFHVLSGGIAKWLYMEVFLR